MPLMRVWAVNSTKRLPAGASGMSENAPRASSTMLLPSGRGVGQRRQGRQPRDVMLGNPLHGDEQRRLAVAQRDRARLVQKQRVDIAGNLDGLTALGDQVGRQRTVRNEAQKANKN